MNLAATLVVVLYTLVPEGHWRQRGKLAATGVVTLAGLARVALGAEAPTDVLVGAAIGVAIPLALFRLFAPNAVFPISYRRGRAAHLDVTGARGAAIRRGLEDQLGLAVTEVKPFGLSGSAGSTPLRITVKGADGEEPTQLFGKLYARSHLRADRWYKLGRELLYGRLEDEKPFNTVRRLVQQEDYALRLCRDAGLPTPRPHGVVELTPEREYLLVTEFFADATELGDAQVDERVIDDGLGIIRKLWEAGLAHRDIKPANLLADEGPQPRPDPTDPPAGLVTGDHGAGPHASGQGLVGRLAGPSGACDRLDDPTGGDAHPQLTQQPGDLAGRHPQPLAEP
jgi:hypothetical protein